MSEKQRTLLLSVVFVSGLCTVRAQETGLTGRDIMVKADERPAGEDHVGWFASSYYFLFEPFLSRF